MLKQKNITREQKKQVNRFLQQIYGFPFKAGGAYLCGAGFEKQGLYTSVYTLQKQALRRIQHSGAAYIQGYGPHKEKSAYNNFNYSTTLLIPNGCRQFWLSRPYKSL